MLLLLHLNFTDRVQWSWVLVGLQYVTLTLRFRLPYSCQALVHDTSSVSVLWLKFGHLWQPKGHIWDKLRMQEEKGKKGEVRKETFNLQSVLKSIYTLHFLNCHHLPRVLSCLLHGSGKFVKTLTRFQDSSGNRPN